MGCTAGGMKSQKHWIEMVFKAEQPENDGLVQKPHWPRMAVSQLKCREFDSRGKQTRKNGSAGNSRRLPIK